MTGIKEIRDHIKSVEQTLKITNAMYLISSANLRRARKQLSDVLPYFTKIRSTITDILCRSPELQHPFFDRRGEIPAEERKTALIIITGDKGLAGSYNHNVLQLAGRHLQHVKNPRLFVQGQVGRVHFSEAGFSLEKPFPGEGKDPSIAHAREISETIIEQFLTGALDDVYIIYTELVTALELEVKCRRLLPLLEEDFPEHPKSGGGYQQLVEYVPSASTVMDRAIPSYITGMIFGALVEAFCAEQNARMTAMQTATDNASELVKKLSLSYNQARQSAITQEITEIVGGSGLFSNEV